MLQQFVARRFALFLACFTAASITLSMLVGIASAQAPAEPEVPAEAATLKLKLSDFDCALAADGSGTVKCTPKVRPAAAPQPAPAGAVATTLALSPPTLVASKPVERNYFVEFLGGLTGELAALVPAFGAALVTGELEDGIVAMPVAYLLVSPFTVAAGVALFSNEDLTYSSALAGASLGTLPGVAVMGVAAALIGDGDAGGFAGAALLAAALTFWVAPVVTMAVAKPASGSPPSDRAKAEPRVLPTAGVTADGSGFTAGLVGRF